MEVDIENLQFLVLREMQETAEEELCKSVQETKDMKKVAKENFVKKPTRL